MSTTNSNSNHIDSKHDRFLRIAENRVNRILDYLDLLGKCSNKRNYVYSDPEIRRIFREVDKKVKETRLLFQDSHLRKKRFVLKK